MSKTNVTLTIDNDITISQEYRQLVASRKLSETINTLLRNALNIKKYEMPKEMSSIDSELQSIAIKKALLEEKKAELQKEADKNDYTKWRRIG